MTTGAPLSPSRMVGVRDNLPKKEEESQEGS